MQTSFYSRAMQVRPPTVIKVRTSRTLTFEKQYSKIIQFNSITENLLAVKFAI